MGYPGILSCACCIGEQDIRAICESFASTRNLPNYPHGIIFTFWEQYVSLRFYLGMALVAALAAIFAILAVVLLNIVAAFLVVCDAFSWRILFINFYMFIQWQAGSP